MSVKSNKPIPEGMHTLTAQLFYNGNCRDAIEFYKKAFQATLIGEIAYWPDGKSVMHAMIRIGDSNLMMSDGIPGGPVEGPTGNSTASLFLYVNDCDAVFNQAVAAGSKALHPLMDAFWGDRMGDLIDPYGHIWGIATHQWDMTAEEMAESQKNWLASLP
jgi:PhnB protein